LVSGKLLFPYITSKQIYFNILIEILLFFWLALIIQYPEFRPKKSWISIGLVGFFIAITISCFTGVDFNLSFWGDIERMLGVFHLLHFLVFYFIIITIMRSWRDWRNLFIVSITAAVFVSLYALGKNIHYSTIGNTAYVSGYMIFNIYFALILFFNELKKGWKNNWLAWLYPVAILIMLSVFKLTHTRGAYVGLGIGAAVMLLLYVLLSKNRKVKIYSLSFLALAIISVSLVFAHPQSSIVKSSSILSTITQISGKTVTFQTRLISWKAALKDFKNHPILGTGHGNYAITFDKYFDPSFYDYTRSETYFDRAHNNIVDIASTTGIAGLLTYLSIFFAVGYYLINGYKKEKIGLHEFVLLSSLIITYFIQNLAVFDSLVTYIPLMATLGFVYWLNAKEEAPENTQDRQFNNKELFILLALGLAVITVLYQYNIKPLKMLKTTIDGQIAFARDNIINGYEVYKKALSYNTILDRDSRDSFVRAITGKRNLLNKIERDKAQEILDYAIEITEKNVEYNPKDSLIQTELAQLLTVAAQFNENDKENFSYYSGLAAEAIDKAIEASPGRMPLYFSKAQIQSIRGENDKAIETLLYAVGLNEKYYDSYCNLSRYYFIGKNEEKGYEAMDKCLDLGGAVLLSPVGYVIGLVNYYTEKKDWDRVLALYKRVSQLKPNDTKVWVNLASLYAQVGEKEKAIEAAKKAGEINPAMKDEVDAFIRDLKN
ncbi:MAG: hypothetical protein GWO79_00785, partial [Actinobacteria bacterium]|nr:hypothetical protein [Actinomycetota bacterium]